MYKKAQDFRVITILVGIIVIIALWRVYTVNSRIDIPYIEVVNITTFWDNMSEEVIVINESEGGELKMVKNNTVYYNSKINRFSQVRKRGGKIFISYTEYYGDASRSTDAAPVTEHYCRKNLKEINNVNDYANFDGIGYRVKKKD